MICSNSFGRNTNVFLTGHFCHLTVKKADIRGVTHDKNLLLRGQKKKNFGEKNSPSSESTERLESDGKKGRIDFFPIFFFFFGGPPQSNGDSRSDVSASEHERVSSEGIRFYERNAEPGGRRTVRRFPRSSVG